MGTYAVVVLALIDTPLPIGAAQYVRDDLLRQWLMIFRVRGVEQDEAFDIEACCFEYIARFKC